MALQINKTFEGTGVTGALTYAKIDRIYGDASNITIVVNFYIDSVARIDKQPIEQGSFTVATPSTDMLPALYAHLKTLPEFSGAVDV